MVQRQVEEEEDGEILQTKQVSGQTPEVTNGIESRIQAIRGGGQPLPASAREYFQPRFGYDLSRVRVHTDGDAVQMSRELNAHAFTHGRNIHFGAGQYSPDSQTGRHLLAHEITHVIQQQNHVPSSIQRRVKVEDHTDEIHCDESPRHRKWEEVRDHIERISTNDTFTVNNTGNMVTGSADICNRPRPDTPVGEACLRDMHCLPAPTEDDNWKIRITDDEWPHTNFEQRRVWIMSSCSPFALGAWGGGASAGQRLDLPNWRVLAHELCGHGWLQERGEHPPFIRIFRGGTQIARPEHDPTVEIENQIANEVDTREGRRTRPRGLFRSPHHGESLARITLASYRTNTSHVHSHMVDDILTIQRFMDNGSVLVDIIGHADHPGTDEYNIRLSEQRAENARRAIVDGNADRAGRIRAVRGRGESECPPVPVDSQGTPECRKVDVYLFPLEGGSEDYTYTGFDDVKIFFQYTPSSILTPVVFLDVERRVEALNGVDDVSRQNFGNTSQVEIDLDLPNMSFWTLRFRLSRELSTLPNTPPGMLENMRRILFGLWVEAQFRP